MPQKWGVRNRHNKENETRCHVVGEVQLPKITNLSQACENLSRDNSRPPAAVIFQDANRRQTLASQGCRSRDTPAGR
jgi:hypothetical protein